MQFLQDLSRGPPSRLKEYQTITGFNHNPHVWFLQEDLRRLLPWENITYDSMHCFFSNGICCQEIGNFYTACLACQRVSRQHILDFIDIGWLSRLCICTELAEREAFESRQRLSGRCCSNNWAVQFVGSFCRNSCTCQCFASRSQKLPGPSRRGECYSAKQN